MAWLPLWIYSQRPVGHRYAQHQPTVLIGRMADQSGFSRWSIHCQFYSRKNVVSRMEVVAGSPAERI